MSSVTSTGMCFLPLSTPNVRPTNCGRIVERRDQVLITSLRPLPRVVSAFLSRNPSTNGPFQTERVIQLPLRLAVARTDDEFRRALVLAGLVTLRAFAPRGDRMTAALGAAFAAAVRMVDRVHRGAANGRTLALPHVAAGFADDFVHVVRVRHRADRGHAGERNAAHFGRVQAQRGVTLVAAEILRVGAGGTCDLTALARLHFDVVDDGADRHRAQRHRIARLHVDLVARDHGVADGKKLRGQDVSEFAVLVFDERDEGRAVGIVFEALDFRRHVELAALEIDKAITLLVTAALPAHGDAAGVVAPAVLRLAFGVRLDRIAFGQARTVDQHQLALTGSRRAILFERHLTIPS